jgi:phage baseplate assembly protein W
MSETAAFLGSGWSFPPRFGAGGGDVAIVSGAEDIRQSLEILLSTRLGERIMQDDYGCDLSDFLFEEIDQGLINALTGVVNDAILYHEPRIILDRLSIDESEARQGLMLIGIEYTIRSTNSRFNMVYPFYLNEAAG